MKQFLLLGIFAGVMSAQSLSIGLLGGAPFTDVVKAEQTNNLSFVSDSTNLVIGPALRIGLPLGFRIEGDALYRPYGFSFSDLTGGTATKVSASDWQFPILLQYRFKPPVVKPFVEGGLAFDHLSNISQAATSVINSGPGQLLHTTNAGVVLGAGVDVKILLVGVSGELRYVRQTASDFQNLSNLNQAEFLVGIHF